MKLHLEVKSGPDAPGIYAIEPGSEIRVGRMPPAQILLSKDRAVSRQHFALIFDGKTCLIRDLKSTHGTSVNGRPVTEARLTNGDLIAAGGTLLRVSLDDGQSTEFFPCDPGAVRPIELESTIYSNIDQRGQEDSRTDLHGRAEKARS